MQGRSSLYRIAAVATLLLVVIGYIYQKYRIAPGIEFAQLEAYNARGERVKVWQKSSRGTVVVFFASWCHDCERELPKLQRVLQGQLKGVDVVALTDEGITTMVQYRDAMKFNFRFYSLPKDFGHYGIHAIPTIYLLNAQGETVFTKVGDVDWNSPELSRQLE
ncbi:alkyl hydroperoxide reductase/ Thiol specific antioxidant/ Mal allergen [Turneriella parva DSM 21527]|uniref:Alkyl hydroperoxide reductase/ Thiol specific antioxidant/ Mal allergen n=1 Tax=Turneriella parva (strain ATCC BAA-1111 / DSM 21527 / NCTC 11395 / H) TaxID=869212 RepID=I4B528_TURPD|nr:alkyl hydroperoxide reductase/ Thiol specific antioxidant/ Mal allergen [Turneriella parva DSM 21527]